MNDISHLVTSDKVDRIKKDLPIGDIVQHYVELSARGKVLVGTCPLCRAAMGFYVMPYKNSFKCFACGLGGDPISFIAKYENLSFEQAVDFIVTKFFNTLGYGENFKKDIIRGDIYVLSLEATCFYIGFTRNFQKRIDDHFAGRGAMWTRLYAPIRIKERHNKKTLNFENYLTQKYIDKYGYQYVRGGDHIFFQKKYDTNQ